MLFYGIEHCALDRDNYDVWSDTEEGYWFNKDTPQAIVDKRNGLDRAAHERELKRNYLESLNTWRENEALVDAGLRSRRYKKPVEGTSRYFRPPGSQYDVLEFDISDVNTSEEIRAFAQKLLDQADEMENDV